MFVLGAQPGIRLIECLSGSECLILNVDGKQITSTGWKSASDAVTGATIKVGALDLSQLKGERGRNVRRATRSAVRA